MVRKNQSLVAVSVTSLGSNITKYYRVTFFYTDYYYFSFNEKILPVERPSYNLSNETKVITIPLTRQICRH